VLGGGLVILVANWGVSAPRSLQEGGCRGPGEIAINTPVLTSGAGSPCHRRSLRAGAAWSAFARRANDAIRTAPGPARRALLPRSLRPASSSSSGPRLVLLVAAGLLGRSFGAITASSRMQIDRLTGAERLPLLQALRHRWISAAILSTRRAIRRGGARRPAAGFTRTCPSRGHSITLMPAGQAS